MRQYWYLLRELEDQTHATSDPAAAIDTMESEEDDIIIVSSSSYRR